MKILNEDALFNSGNTRYFRELASWMLNGKSYEEALKELGKSYDEKTARNVQVDFHNLISSSTFEADPAAIDKLTVLVCASDGPDTKKNPALGYLASLPTMIWRNKLSQIKKLCNEIRSGNVQAIDASGAVFPHLYNYSLYDRTDNEFLYAYRAFDTLLTDKYKTYFDTKVINGKRAVLINLGEDKARLYFDDAARLEGDNFNDRTNYTGLDQSTQGYYELSCRFFYTNMQQDTTGKDTIIPSTRGDRNIYEYMEIWTNSVEESDMGDEDQPQQKQTKRNQQRNQQRQQSNQREESRQVVNRIKDIIGSSKLNANSRQELMNLLNQLL